MKTTNGAPEIGSLVRRGGSEITYRVIERNPQGTGCRAQATVDEITEVAGRQPRKLRCVVYSATQDNTSETTNLNAPLRRHQANQWLSLSPNLAPSVHSRRVMLTETQKAERSAKRAATKARIASHREKISACVAAAKVVVATGKCPDCGAGIHQNITIAGWWQCDRSGSASFRRDHSGAPCLWQVFTE